MSDMTVAEGEIRVTPALTWSQVRDSDFLPALHLKDAKRHVVPTTGRWTRQRELIMNVLTAEVQTDDGVLTRKWVETIEPYTIDKDSFGYLQVDLQTLIDAFPKHQFTGYLELNDEEEHETWRVVIDNRKVKRVDPEITWPGRPELYR